MRLPCSSQMFKTFFLTILLCLLLQVDGRIRRRRQYIYTNYGSLELRPEVMSYYGMSGSGQFTGNGQQNNRFVVGGVAYQYPTPVNVMSGGSYDAQAYNAYPSGGDAYSVGNQNNMRLPTQDGWYPAGYFQRYPFLAVYASATRMTGTSTLTMIVCLTLTPLLVSMGVF